MAALKNKEYITLSDVAKELGFSLRTIQHWAHTGRLESFKFFGRVVVEREYLEDWKARNAVKKETP